MCLQQPFSSNPKPLTVLETLVASTCFLQNRPTCCTCPEAMAGTKWGKEWVLNICLFVCFTTVQRGLKRETHVTTHPTGCSVLCDLHIPVCQPLTQPHTNRQNQFQSRQYAKHIKKKSQPTGSAGQQRIMGALTRLAFWEGASLSPVCSLSWFELWPHTLSCLQTKKKTS